MIDCQVNSTCRASVVVEMPNKISFSYEFRIGGRGNWLTDLYPVVEMLEEKYATEYPDCKVTSNLNWDMFDEDDEDAKWETGL